MALPLSLRRPCKSSSLLSRPYHELHVVDHRIVPAEDLGHVQLRRLGLGDRRRHVAVAAQDEGQGLRIPPVVVFPRGQPTRTVLFRYVETKTSTSQNCDTQRNSRLSMFKPHCRGAKLLAKAVPIILISNRANTQQKTSIALSHQFSQITCNHRMANTFSCGQTVSFRLTSYSQRICKIL